MKTLKITSISNPIIKAVVKLRERPSREGGFLIEGPHLLQSALLSDQRIHNIFFTSAFSKKSEGRRLLKKAEADNVRLIEVDEALISKISDAVTSQGVAAVVDMPAISLAGITLSALPLIVVCDGLQDPGNLGTIIRTADAAGADAVVLLSGCCNPYNPKSVRSTAGSIFNIQVVSSSVSEFIDYALSGGISICCSSARGSMSVFEADLLKPLAMVFGSEAHGIDESIVSAAGFSVAIPMQGGTESLNVASSAAVCLYEAVRQRLYMLEK
ncbi:MAG: RNA methyltransferase [Dissulfurispiraceae bacterium]|jgi:TrmH family RNA methyltransferase|nr:RNA methyltransferase [Dissulfurispiraceae bacterium]